MVFLNVLYLPFQLKLTFSFTNGFKFVPNYNCDSAMCLVYACFITKNKWKLGIFAHKTYLINYQGHLPLSSTGEYLLGIFDQFFTVGILAWELYLSSNYFLFLLIIVQLGILEITAVIVPRKFSQINECSLYLEAWHVFCCNLEVPSEALP